MNKPEEIRINSSDAVVNPSGDADISSMRYYEQRLHLREIKKGGGFGDKEMDFPSWLVDGSEFASNFWQCQFGENKSTVRIVVDFNIKLADRSMLTSPENALLLRGFKVFLVVQIHPKYNGGKRRQAETEANIFRCGLKFLDHLLIQGGRLHLGTAGLNLLRKTDFTDYLIRKTGCPASTSMYEYPTKLALLLKQLAAGVSDADVEHVAERFPYILDIPPSWDRNLDLTDPELIKARAYIIDNNHYSLVQGLVKYNSSPFLVALYRNTLSGMSIVAPTFQELNEGVAWYTEYAGVPVRNESTPPVSLRMLRRHFRVVQKMGLVHELVPELLINVDACTGYTFDSVYGRVDKKQTGRYRSLSAEVVLGLIKDSYNYIHENSNVVFGRTALHSMDNMHNPRYFQANHDGSCSERLARSLRSDKEFECWMIPRSIRDHDYFDFFRSGASLFSSYITLVGSYLLIIGALTARRQAELLGLAEDNCLLPNKDPHLEINGTLEYELGFMAGKTGNRHEKEFMTVPIPRLVAKLLWNLKQIHQDCTRIGLIPKNSPLIMYVRPDNLKFRSMCASSYNSCLNAICDFSETPTIVDENGITLRFYVRQHQLRRFFAMAFFSSAGFKELDALRAFLGHSDIQHLYTYIVEVVPGAMLQGVKTDTLTDAILSGDSTIENINTLKKYLCDLHDIQDLTVKSIPALRALLKKSSETEEEPSSSMLAQMYESDIYSNINFLLGSKLINLEPTFARMMTDEGVMQDVHLMVKVNY